MGGDVIFKRPCIISFIMVITKFSIPLVILLTKQTGGGGGDKGGQ
jgi:hypothetical protein